MNDYGVSQYRSPTPASVRHVSEADLLRHLLRGGADDSIADLVEANFAVLPP